MKKLITRLAVIVLSAAMMLSIMPGTLMAEEAAEEYQEPVLQEAPAVVSLNGTDYSSFAQALTNVQSGDNTLVLKDNVVLANPVTVSVPWGTSVTLDLGGYTIKLLDPSEDSAGQDCSGSDYTGDGGLFVVKSGTFNIVDSDYYEEGKITSSNNAQPAFKVIWDASNGTYLNLKGGNFVASSYQNLIALRDDYGSEASLQDGEVVISGGYYNAMQPAQYLASGKTMTDAGGYYELTDAPVINTYTVTWYDAYGNVLQSVPVNEGEGANFSGEYPTKEADADYTYTFSNWDQDTGAVYNDMYVNPVFSATPIIHTYSVTWYDAYGNVLQSATVNEGEGANFSGEYPTKEADADYTYTFSNWDQDTGAVYNDMYVNPVFSATPIVHTYAVTFDVQAEDVPVPDGQIVEQGDTASEPAAPVRDGYRFRGWFESGAETPFDFNTPIYADLTLYAGWQQQFDVSYSTAHGYVPQSMRVYAGDTINRPEPDPTEDGWVFGGWFTDEACTQEYVFGSEIYDNLMLYAKWDEVVPAEYEVSFEVKEDPAKAPETEIVEEGQLASDPGPVEVEGYNFAGWFEEGAEQAYDFQEPVYGNVVLMAMLDEKTTYPVTFYSDHGVVPDGQMVEEGGFVQKPDDLSEEGWTFDGWFEPDAVEPYDFDTPVYSEISLYAKWTENPAPVTKFEVTFDVQGHGIAPEKQDVEEGQTATRPEKDPEEEGWIFGGWYQEAECTNVYDFTAAVNDNLTIFAKWTENPAPVTTFEVTFDVQGHGIAPEKQDVEEGNTATKPVPDPSESGWTFGGWYQEAECTNVYDFTAAVNDNLTLFAKWTENPVPVTTYEVSFDVQGHGTAPAKQTVEEGKTATKPAPDPSESGWTFGGWYQEAECTNVYDFTAAVSDNLTLFAKWTENPVPVTTYEVSFDVQGHGTAPAKQTVEAGKAATRPEKDPTADGWTFGGWYKEAACTNVYDFTAAVNSNLTVYAKWTKNQPATYTVTFSYNGRGTDPYKTEEVTDGQKVTKPADPTAEGYIFGGWFTDTACKNQFNFNTPIKEYLILYAKWTEAPTVIESFSVTFYTAHGETPDGQLVQKNQKAAQPKTPTASGYIFEGWYSDMEYQNKYDFNTPVTQNLTLYAKWSEEPTTILYFKVSFYTEHGTAPAEQTVEKGHPAVKPADPTAEGFVFGGWYTDKELQKLYDFNTAVTANMTLFAKWTQLPSQNYIVSFNSNGHGNTPNPQTVTGGQMAQKPADPVATGYTFTGWFLDTAGTQPYNFRAAVSANLTLYAGWTANRYTIRYDANSGVGTMASTSCVYDTATGLPANAFTRSGYYFVGWNTMADGSGVGIADKAEVHNLTSTNGETVSLYAQWKNIYNVIEGANGKVQKGGRNGITFRVDGDYSKFTGIRIDENNVAATQYTAWSGSTYVQLHADYVNQMQGGEHTIRFLFTDGSVETKFEVVSGTPKTGDTNNALVWILIAIAALIVIVVIVLIILLRRRRETSDYDPEPRYDERYDDEYEDDRYDDDEYEDDRYDDQEDYRDDRSDNRRGR